MREPVIGIDLGTTNSAAAFVERGRPQLIPSRDGARLTPSVVGFRPDGERVVGLAAQALQEDAPERVVSAAKRFIGRRWSEALAEEARHTVPYAVVQGPNEEVRVAAGDSILPVAEVSAMVLMELRLDAQAFFGRPVTKAVITVPANFDDAQRQATKQAAAIAGLEVLRIINEPTAAALAYGLSRGFEGRALVFDLGGGTFDVSILDVAAGVYEVKATGGDPLLGGEDFDRAVVQWLLEHLPEGARATCSAHKPSLQRLRSAAQRARHLLTTEQEARVELPGLGDPEAGPLVDVDALLSRATLERLCAPLAARCVAACERVMAEVGAEPAGITAVLLVGGMTRMPLVREAVTRLFGRAPATDLDPDAVVALGAAVQASELADKRNEALLIDVASHSLGVGFMGSRVRRLIPKNTPIPVTVRETFLPGHAGQRAARIPIFQGEAATQAGNTRLGELVLRGLQARERADAAIEVTFTLSTEGILSVEARDVARGTAEALRLEARTELTRAEVQARHEAQRAYLATRAHEDGVAAKQAFAVLLRRAQRLHDVLVEASVLCPSPETQASAVLLRKLVPLGRRALEQDRLDEMAELRRRLLKLLWVERRRTREAAAAR